MTSNQLVTSGRIDELAGIPVTSNILDNLMSNTANLGSMFDAKQWHKAKEELLNRNPNPKGYSTTLACAIDVVISAIEENLRLSAFRQVMELFTQAYGKIHSTEHRHRDFFSAQVARDKDNNMLAAITYFLNAVDKVAIENGADNLRTQIQGFSEATYNNGAFREWLPSLHNLLTETNAASIASERS